MQACSDKVVPLDGQASANELNIDFSTCVLDSHDEAEVVSMVEENSDVFAKSWSDLGCTDLHTHKIDTGEAHPIRSLPYKTSPVIKQEISRQVKALLELGIIEENDDCEWCSPVVMIKKSDGNSWCMAIDYRHINAVTKPMI
ncbi:uncharacterized protein [Watersipora subatra]|uniref:uncharacterized protein n=1 Tax=Watersipora subatra TaxID=2589382 RepID=UPI00355B1E7A